MWSTLGWRCKQNTKKQQNQMTHVDGWEGREGTTQGVCIRVQDGGLNQKTLTQIRWELWG